ncbi:MAG: hypothetical protein QW727_04415 [Candidatus Pacearchaeota archaeon]
MTVILPTHKCVFIHIPRTGGRSISLKLKKFLNEHSTFLLREYRHQTFVEIRNLFSRSISEVDNVLIIRRKNEEILKSLKAAVFERNEFNFDEKFLRFLLTLNDEHFFLMMTGSPYGFDTVDWYLKHCGKKCICVDFENLQILLDNIDKKDDPVEAFLESGGYEVIPITRRIEEEQENDIQNRIS